MVLAGIDVGYSSVKIAYGNGRTVQPNLLQLPIGAAPASRCGVGVDGQLAVNGGQRVRINGEDWVAGIDPSQLQDFVQSMDETYVTTDEYRALFYAALAAIGAPKIDVLVTGLPVSHFRDETIRRSLESRMAGRHYIRDGLVVEVAKVVVAPQPAGAFSAHAVDQMQGPPRQRISRGRSVLVVDPGHYSLDWIIFLDSFQLGSSGSNARAGEAVIREAAKALSQQHGIRVRPARLQEAVLEGAARLEIGSSSLDFWPALKSAASGIVENSLREIRGSIRSVNDQHGVDLVLVAGGGADLFTAPLSEAFPESVVARVANPQMANARGFYIYGMQAGAAASTAA